MKIRPGQVLSPTNITWFGPGVMQTAFGAPTPSMLPGGGVGPLTRAFLLTNVVELAEGQ